MDSEVIKKSIAIRGDGDSSGIKPALEHSSVHLFSLGHRSPQVTQSAEVRKRLSRRALLLYSACLASTDLEPGVFHALREAFA